MSQPSPEPRSLPGVASPVAAAILAGALVWLVWWALVSNRSGQALDALALEGSKIGAWRLDAQADQLLGSVSIPLVAGMIMLVLIIGALRGRWVAAAAAAIAIAGANVTTQVVKNQLLTRADLLGMGSWSAENTLPSGHTTVAAAGLVGLILVVPPVLRSLTTLVSVAGVGAFGFATLVSQWHRPSDVVAAVLVAVGWGYLAVAVMRIADKVGRVRDEAHRPGAMSVILVMLAICGLALSAAGGFLSWNVDPDRADRTTAFIAYVAGVAAVGGVTCGGLGALLRMVDASRPIPRSREKENAAQPAAASAQSA